MARKKTAKKPSVKPKMLSIREDQYDRIVAICKEEDRTIRGVIERMIDNYEGKGKK